MALTCAFCAGYSSNLIQSKTILAFLAAAVASAVLVACGGGESGIESGAADSPAGAVPSGEPGDELTISQWPLYIDPGKDGTVAEFERDTGIDVDYIEDINDNVQFYGKLRPQLERGPPPR